MHVLKTTLTEDLRRINPHKLDVMGRLGRSNYVRVKGDNVIPLYQSIVPDVIGYDQLPQDVKTSTILSGNDIAEMAALTTIPDKKQIWLSQKELITQNLTKNEYHEKAAALIRQNMVQEAFHVALIPEYFSES